MNVRLPTSLTLRLLGCCGSDATPLWVVSLTLHHCVLRVCRYICVLRVRRYTCVLRVCRYACVLRV